MVKILKKELYLGIVTLIISLLALISGTYAWFTQNNTVKTKGMLINVATEGLNFEITNKYDSIEGKPVFLSGTTEITVSYDTRSSLIPIYPENLQPFTGLINDVADWYHALSNSYDDAEVNKIGNEWNNLNYDLSRGYGYIWNDDGLGLVSEPFAMIVPFYVRLNPDSAGEDIKLVDIKANNLQIVDSSGLNRLKDCVYLLVSGPSGTYRITIPEATANEPFLIDIPSETGILIDQLSPTDEYKPITVFVFFDGRDKDCKSSNYSADNISISLEFTGIQG